MGHSETETDQETRSNKHLDIDGSRLQNDTDDHDAASGNDTSTSAEIICDVRGDGKGGDGTNRLDGVQQPSHRGTGVIES